MDIRRAESEDVDSVVETITHAFRRDPVWRPAFAGADGSDDYMSSFWRIYVAGGLRHGTVFVSPNAATVSVWIPPGEAELSPDQEAAAHALANDVLGHGPASALFELWDRFDQHHPNDEPHAYLSLLATHPDHAGRGLGQAHLESDLARWDAVDVPTYLESSNPANNHRYERQGYAKVGEFRTVVDAAVVTTMWRPARKPI